MVDEIGGRFGDDDVARIEEQLADHVKKLLRPRGDDDIVAVERKSRAFTASSAGRGRESFRATAHNPAWCRIASAACAVARIAQHVVHDLANLGGGERFGIDQTGGQADEVGIFNRLLHEIADRLVVSSRGPLGDTKWHVHVINPSKTLFIKTKNPENFSRGCITLNPS